VEPQKPNDKSNEGRESAQPELIFELDSLQFFDDHDTRGDPRYPPVKLPRDVPRSIEEWRLRRNR
jgi:hypothetical protein